MRKRPKSLGPVQRSAERGGAHVVATHCRVFAVGSTRSSRPSSWIFARSRWRTTWCQRRRRRRCAGRGDRFSARALPRRPWAPELGTRMCCETPVSVGHVFARSMLGLRCPWTTLRLALKGSGGPDRRYGVLRARNAKTLLVDVFLYLTVVCWTSKKSLFSWRIPSAEFLIHFQDPSRAGL